MKAYNEKVLNSFQITNNLDANRIVSLLEARLNNIDDPNYQMSYKELIEITAIDNYMIKQIIDDVEVLPNSNLDIYLKELRVLLNKQPLLYYQLPIKGIKIERLKKYIPDLDNIRDLIDKKVNDAKQIYMKFELAPESLNKEEKRKLIEFFTYIIPTDNKNLKNAQDKLARYLLNGAASLGVNATTFIIKYFGYQKAKERGLDDTEILIGNLEDKNTLGISGYSFVVVNKETISNVSFQDNKLDNMYGTLGGGRREGLAVLQTIYHELRHQQQDKLAKSGDKSDISYYMATRNLLGLKDSDEYKRNYRTQAIEKDANQAAWRDLESTIKNYLPNYDKGSITLSRIFKYGYEEFIQRELANQKDSDGNSLFASDFITKNLDEIFINNPDLLNKYPQFKEFYNLDGKSKDTISLLTNETLAENDTYAGQVMYRFKTGGLPKSSVDKLSTLEKKQMIINLDQVMYEIYSKMRNITSYIKYKGGLEKRIKESPGVIKQLELNMKCYQEMAGRLHHIANQMIVYYKELNNPDLNIDYYFDRNNHSGGIEVWYKNILRHLNDYEMEKARVLMTSNENNKIEGDNYGGK